MKKYFEINTGLNKFSSGIHISEWKSKGFSDDIIRPPTLSNNKLAPKLSYVDTNIRVELDGNYLKQDYYIKVTFNHGTIVNIYIVYV